MTHIPATDVIRAGYVDARYFNSQGMESREDVATEFDRWLAQERAKAKAEALRTAATELEKAYEDGVVETRPEYVLWLRDRANETERAES